VKKKQESAKGKSANMVAKGVEMNRAKKVARILNETVLGWGDPLPASKDGWHTVKLSNISLSGIWGGILFDSGRVLLLRDGFQKDITGVIGGFNASAPSAAQALRDLGVITDDECAAFIEWFYRQKENNAREAAHSKLLEDAERLGYEVVVKKGGGP